MSVSAAPTAPLPVNPAATPPAGVVYPSAPPQDQGLPYTRSGPTVALAKISNQIAVFAGSRYAYVRGFKVRLSDATPEAMLHAEAVMENGRLYVPQEFAGLLSLKSLHPDPAPAYLAGRWVYTLPRPPYKPAKGVNVITLNGLPYVDLAAAADALRLPHSLNARGLFLIGTPPATFGPNDAALLDAVITLFDTPDKLADPDIATNSIPLLKIQGKWTDHVQVTPDQLKLLDGPETVWPSVPVSSYDYSGFNTALLGSNVPPPGVYPRLLFSPQDVPMLLKRMQRTKTGQITLLEWDVLFHKTWWNPATSDGQIFQKLAAGDTQDLKWPDTPAGTPLFMVPHGTFASQTPGIFNSHVAYVTNCLTSMALYCLLTGDDAHGRQAASAIVNYYKLVEPMVDALNAMSDSELGVNADLANFGTTSWRGMNGVVNHMDLPFALDFAGHWMTSAQKEEMRRFIVKATYGRRDNMQAATPRVKDVNHMTWHLTDYLAAAAIEGQAGCDPEVLEAGRESARSFLDWGVDEKGQMFESNGKSGGGIQFQMLTMNVLARRGLNLWGHPHWRKMLSAQVYTTSPDGQVTVSSGTYGGGPFAMPAVDEIKAFYPGSKAADWLLTQHPMGTDGTNFHDSNRHVTQDLAAVDLTAYRAQLEKATGRLRLPGPTYPSFVLTGIYDADWQPVTRADLNQPLVWNDPVHGILSAASDDTPQAAWLCLHVRSNQYIGAGHHHADVGMFYFSGGGVNWFTESSFAQAYDGKYHNEVLIDGIAEPDGLPGRGDYLGAAVTPQAAFGTVDQTHSYSYRWLNQVMLWNDTGMGSPWSGAGEHTWELETDPYTLAVYKGTQHWKSRPWWPTYNFSNWMPVVRTPYNPVQYAFRSAGLVQGPHPYGLIVDDLKKDNANHLYQWAAVLGDGVQQLSSPGAMPSLQNSDVVLARTADVSGGAAQAGAPLLLVRVLGAEGPVAAKVETADGPLDKKQQVQPYQRLVADVTATQVRFKVLLLPFHQGDALPSTSFDVAAGTASIVWPGQTDTLSLTPGADNRTRFVLVRDGKTLVAVK